MKGWQWTKRVWRPVRNQKVAVIDELPFSRETALCRMIEIRQRKDPRSRRYKRPENWPMFQLWKTIEADILDIVEQYHWLCDGGLTSSAALEKIESFQNGTINSNLRENPSLHSYIACWLARTNPDYIALGDCVLREVTQIAEKWTYARLEQVKTEQPFPPNDWLKKRVSISEVEIHGSTQPKEGSPTIIMLDDTFHRSECVSAGNKEWRRIKLRMVLSDELWTYSSPTDHWQRLAGRMGIALIRNGRSIGHVITVMN